MNKNDVRDLVYAELSKALLSSGFRLNKSEGAFVRKIPGGLQKIFVPLIDYNPDFIFSLMVGIRLDAVEDIFNRFSGAQGQGQQKTLTSMTPLAYFTEGRRKDYKVSTPAEIEIALSDLASVIESKILPFLKQYHDVQSLDSAINTTTPTEFDTSNLASHAMHSVILAKLAGKNRFNDLVAKYENEMKGHIPADRERFTRLVAYLQSLSPGN
jgi:hypothetical protein